MSSKDTSLPAEYKNLVHLTDRVLSVPKSEILRRESEYKKNAALNLRRRGPKPKVNSAASAPVPDDV